MRAWPCTRACARRVHASSQRTLVYPTTHECIVSLGPREAFDAFIRERNAFMRRFNACMRWGERTLAFGEQMNAFGEQMNAFGERMNALLGRTPALGTSAQTLISAVIPSDARLRGREREDLALGAGVSV